MRTAHPDEPSGKKSKEFLSLCFPKEVLRRSSIHAQHPIFDFYMIL
jgi:hypothetical protein